MVVRKYHPGKWLLIGWVLACVIYAQDIIPLKDIKSGMSGYGLSVFRGHKIERFEVQVIDILTGFMPGEDMILIRCSPTYGGFDIDKSGLIAGMSGSPIYFDNKLAGALSMGWSFTKEPLAGVTPIEAMIAVAERPLENKTAALQPQRRSAAGGLVNMQTPIMVSGITPAAFDKVREQFSQMGWLAVYGGYAQGLRKENYRLEPGSAIGAQIMSGDMDFTAIGTVTWIRKNDVLAFGHSFLNAGELNMPITTAHIHTVIPSNMVSFKLGCAVEKVGTLLQDRTPAIYGKQGKTCDMIPMTMSIKNKTLDYGRNFHVEMISQPYLTTRICSIAIFNFLDMQENVFGENSVWVRSKVYLKDRTPVEWSNMYSNLASVKADFTGPLQYLCENPFEVLHVEKIDIEVEISYRARQAEISSLQVENMSVEAGSDLRLKIGLRPYRQPERFIDCSFPIPKKLAADSYEVVVVGGQQITPPIFMPENIEQYIRAVRKLNTYKNNEILVAMVLPKIKVFCQGQEMDELPGSVVGNLLPVNRSKDVQILPDFYCKTIESEYVISGMAGIIVEVRNKETK